MAESGKKTNLEIEDEGGVKKELQDLYEASLKQLKEGSITKGTIIHIKDNIVLLDMGYKAEGVLLKEEFLDTQEIFTGNEVDVFIVSLENKDGLVVLSKRRADKILGWEKINTVYKEGDVVKGKVVKRVKGGLIVNIGVEAFLPASLVDIKGVPELDSLLNKVVQCKIVSINLKRKNVVVSRKDYLMQEVGQKRKEFLDGIEPGSVVEGIVKNITDYGAFIEIDIVDGLLHISDMSWGRINHPSELFAVGDKANVKILDVDKNNQRVSLGLKQLTLDPWTDVATKYSLGSEVKGKIINILPYGAFVELSPGVEGFIHVSDLSWTKKIRDAHEMFAIGDIIGAIVLSIDVERRKMALGIKQLEQDPWKDIESNFPLDSNVTGKVVGFNEDGAFVEVENGIDGFISKNDISWTRRINHAYEVLKKGQKEEFQITGINKSMRQLILSLKQLKPNPWPQIEEKYKSGVIVEGEVTSVFPFGVFVQLEEDLEGLLHISEIGKSTSAIQDRFITQDVIKVQVLSIDKEKKQVRLSNKGLELTEQTQNNQSQDVIESQEQLQEVEEQKEQEDVIEDKGLIQGEQGEGDGAEEQIIAEEDKNSEIDSEGKANAQES
ncbi:MAG: S1 RNA-binding domain-containing protein [Candidatus Saelkia tenebricola]|nr:S1 RNA-binding domain-containing protein [Candidatus Saelkia tenebricola]